VFCKIIGKTETERSLNLKREETLPSSNLIQSCNNLLQYVIVAINYYNVSLIPNP
jgi:hypothetical protein